ncbi:MAG: hypothetical protein HPY83_08580 [Anaerolineae bacterium]|nr:hypothetical protein [Anaerolineae bacterium]
MKGLTAIVLAIAEWGRRLARRWGWSRGGATREGGQDWTGRFLSQVLAQYHFTSEASDWLRREITVRVDDPHSTRGGGYWIPEERRVRLLTAQHEAAVHELAHAWWHDRRRGQERALMEAVTRAAHEPDPRYQQVRRLAEGYVYGTAHDGWPGLLVDSNDWEMFAGLASGTMGDLRLMPAYLRAFYRGLFQEPEETPDGSDRPVLPS